MKKFILLLCLLMAPLSRLFATIDGTYIVYFEETYVQGPWNDGERVFNNPYLLPKFYTELMGSVEVQVYQMILDKLKAEKPSVYSAVEVPFIDEPLNPLDTVLVKVGDIQQKNWLTIKNEILASFTANGNCKVVLFERKGKTEYLTAEDIDYPKFTLGGELTIDTAKATKSDTINPNANRYKDIPSTIGKPLLNLPFWISIGLNILLIIFIILKRRPKKD